jgi:CO/xanthine dehydrogenase Mo-binding subunit
MGFEDAGLTRRSVVTGGVLVVGFSLFSRPAAAQQPPKAPAGPPFGDLKTMPMLDSWIRVDTRGTITVFTGKAELGQGIKTALIQIAAEQLAVAPDQIHLVTASTARTPNEGYTAGSKSMEMSGTAILHAASQVRNLLLGWAAVAFGADVSEVKAANGRITGPGGKAMSYGDAVKGHSLHIAATAQNKLIPAAEHKVMGRSLPRVDIPAKLTGGAAYVQDFRPAGMVHARVVRPPNYGATLRSVDTAAVAKLPGVIKVVHEGSYLAVIAQNEYQAIIAMRALQAAARWTVPSDLPDESRIFATIRTMKSKDQVIDHRGPGALPVGAHVIEASYRRPYLMHGSIGPSCAVGLYPGDHLTVWTHSQGVYPLRASIANMLSMPNDRVDCIHMEGSGCYGHNAADDAAADAAILARALPGRPVRVQWMREDEHGWEPFGSAMVTLARATLDGRGRISGWDYEVWSMPHSSRPDGSAANLMPAWYLPAKFGPPQGQQVPLPSGGGDRNAIPTYAFPNTHIVDHFIPEMPVRVSALRSLGGFLNVFSIESFMDELARAAKVDPVEFRLRHLTDPRATDAVRLAAEKFGWQGWKRMPGRGRGFAYVRYETTAAYCAIALEVTADRDSGQVRLVRAVAAVDSGEAVNPDGIRNQIEGAIMQSASWTLYEEVGFSRTEIVTRDWGSYPILRFDAVPDSIDVHVITRPGQPFLGTGEAGQGPTAAAIANAIADATGVRLRQLPLTAAKLRAGMLALDN